MSETETKERQTIIDRLDKEIEDPNARNFLDTLSLKLLKVITPTEARTMLDKFFIKNTPPTQTHTPTPTPHLHTNISTLDINTLAKLVTDAQTNRDSTNDTHIKPPILYGSEPLTQTDIDTLRLYRKDTRGFASLEGTLQYINQFLQDKEHIVNEHELVKTLCIILPTDCLETLEHLRFKNAGIEETYRTLQTIHGKLKSVEDIQNSIERIVRNKDNNKPQQVIDQIGSIILKSKGAKDTLDQTAIRETKRYLKDLGGEGLWAAIAAHLSLSKNKSFSELNAIVREYFSDTLIELWEKKSKIRSIKEQEQLVSEHKTDNTNIEQKHAELIDTIKHLMGKDSNDLNRGQQDKRCYTCNKYGHIQRECNLNRAQNNTNRTEQYKNLPCMIHSNSNHNNYACMSQQKQQCTEHGSNTNTPPHSAANCLRNIDKSTYQRGGGYINQYRRNTTSYNTRRPPFHPPNQGPNHRPLLFTGAQHPPTPNQNPPLQYTGPSNHQNNNNASVNRISNDDIENRIAKIVNNVLEMLP